MSSKIFTFFICLLAFSSLAQERNNYNLLWKIESPHNDKLSYLFGTAHIKNNLAYDFSDSVLIAFEDSEVLALEINIEDYFQTLLDERLSDTRNYLKEELTENEYSKLKENVEEDLDFQMENLKTISPRLIRRMYSDKFFESDENNLVIDDYFYDRGKKLGKDVIGLEKLNEGIRAGMGFRDDAEKQSFIKEIINDNLKEEDLLSFGEIMKSYSNFLNVYYQGNVDSIYNMYNLKTLKGSDPYKLVERNLIMAIGLDSILVKHKTFVAVGAAHLGGEMGLIELLRKKGYKLSPVQADFTGKAEKKMKEFDKIGGYVLESISEGYRIKLLTKPISIVIPNSNAKMMLANDISGQRAQISLVVQSPDIALSKEEIYQNMIQGMALQSKGTVEDEKNIEHDGLKGKKVILKTEAGDMVLFIFNKKSQFYVFGEIRTDRELKKSETKEFLKNIEFFNFIKTESNWKILEDLENQFTMTFPEKHSFITQYEPMSDSDSDLLEIKAYTAIDQMENSYSAYIYKYPSGFAIEGDTLFSELLEETYSSEMGFNHLYTKNIKFGSYDAYDMMFQGDDYFIKTKLVIRGNKPYALVYQGKDSTNEFQAQFFEDFKFTELPSQIPLEKFEDKNLDYSFMAPKRRAEMDVHESYQSFILNSEINKFSDEGGNFFINVFKSHYSRFTFYHNVDSLVNSYNYEIEEDEMLSDSIYRNSTNGLVYEFCYKKKSESMMNRNRIYLFGSYLYHIECILPLESDLTILDPMLESLKFSPKEDFDFYSSKKVHLLKALVSADSSTYRDGIEALSITDLDSTDLPAIYSIFKNHSPLDSGQFGDARNALINNIEIIGQESSVDFLSTFFDSTQNKNLKSSAFGALGSFALQGKPEAFLSRYKDVGSHLYYTSYFYDTILNVKENLEILVNGIDNPFTATNSFDLLSFYMGKDEDLDKGIAMYSDRFLAYLKGLADTLDMDSIDYYKGSSMSKALSILTKLDGLENEMALLEKLKSSQYADLRYSAIAARIKYGVELKPKEMRKILENDSYPLAFVNSLVAAGQEDYLKKHLDQKMMVEIIIKSNLSDEGYESIELHFLETQNFIVEGVEQKLYYFYYTNNWDESKSMAISGWQPIGEGFDYEESYSDLWSYEYSPEKMEEIKAKEMDHLKKYLNAIPKE